MGTGAYLRSRKRDIRIVGVEPKPGHKIQGLKSMKEAIVPAIYREENLDEKLIDDDDPAFETTRRLAVEEGVFVGMSSGAVMKQGSRLLLAEPRFEVPEQKFADTLRVAGRYGLRMEHRLSIRWTRAAVLVKDQ
jgi:cysteine synthase